MGWSNTGVEVLEVVTVIITTGTPGSGIFVYDGTPAAGNLIGSWAAAAGDDAFGNPYPQGLMIGTPANSSTIVLGETGGSPLIYFPTGRSQVSASAAIQAITMGTGAPSYEQIQIISARDSTENDLVGTTWLSSSPDGSQIPQIQEFYQDSLGGLHFYRIMSLAGDAVTGSLTATHPTGSPPSRTTPAVAETWQTASLAANFGTNVGDQAPRFRMDGLAGGIVRLDGVAYTTAATAASATIFTLPPGYRPTQRKRFTTPSNASGLTGATVGAATVIVATSGAVELGPAANAAGQQIVLEGCTFPVD